MIEPEEVDEAGTINLTVGHMPENHVVVGYIAYLKVLDKDGEEYWASRDNGLGDMEMLGMAHDLADEYQSNIRSMRRTIGGDNG